MKIRSENAPAGDRSSGRFKICGTGICLPQKVVTASELDRLIGKPDGWTARHTGVLERRWVEGELQSELGAAAARAALQEAGLDLGAVDVLIGASGVPEQPIPCTAARILAELDPAAKEVAAYDLNATCLSFLVAFDHAAQLIETGRANCVLLVSSEIASLGLDFSEAESAALMGDGAAAVLLRREEDGGRVLASRMQTFPEGIAFAELKGGGTRHHPTRCTFRKEDHLFHMKGKELFRLVSQHLGRQVAALMDAEGISWSGIKAVLAHQASGPAVELLGNRLGIPEEKLVRIYPRCGNTIAASLPMCLHELRQGMALESGDRVLFIGTSAGVSIASLLLEV